MPRRFGSSWSRSGSRAEWAAPELGPLGPLPSVRTDSRPAPLLLTLLCCVPEPDEVVADEVVADDDVTDEVSEGEADEASEDESGQDDAEGPDAVQWNHQPQPPVNRHPV